MPKYSTIVSSQEDLAAAVATGLVQDVLLETAALSVRGFLTLAQAQKLSAAARALGLKPILVWDNLLPQRDFDAALLELKKLDLTAFAAVRVRDLGAAKWLYEQTQCQIQLIAEFANNNTSALLAWRKHFSAANNAVFSRIGKRIS